MDFFSPKLTYKITVLLVLLLFISEVIAQPMISPEPENLGANVNSVLSELIPRISPDGKTLYFVRESTKQVGKEVVKRQDIWYSQKQPDGSWGLAKNMGSPLNHPDHNSAVLGVSPDGTQLVILYHYISDGVIKPGFSISSLDQAGNWSKPEPQFIENFSNKSNKSSYYLSNDGQTMVLDIQGDDSYGMQDLYVCFKKSDGSWTQLKNLGPAINTPEYEFSPFLASDNVTLFFASSGHGGLGSVDIFVSQRIDDSWQEWSKPVNLGPAINTPGLDAYFSIPASGDYAYYTSTQKSFGGHDIMKIQLPKDLCPKPVVFIKGQIINKSSKKYPSKIKYETLHDGITVGSAEIQDDGTYSIILPAGTKYGVFAESQDFLSVNQNIDLTLLPAYKEITQFVEVVPIEAGAHIVMNNIFFDTGNFNIKSESYPELKRIIDLMKKYQTMNVEITGHTDNMGSEAANQKLSLARAKSVMDYIISGGIPSNRITSIGHGTKFPIAKNDTDENRSKNRRVEFHILKK